MNWGRRLKRAFTENWREKIISLVLAFLFWFMIKAQDARYAQPYVMPQPAQILPPSTPAPARLEPTLPTTAPISSQLEPGLQPPASVLTPPASVLPLPGAGAEPGAALGPQGKATGL